MGKINDLGGRRPEELGRGGFCFDLVGASFVAKSRHLSI